MEPDDSNRYSKLDPKDSHDFLMKIAIDTLTSQSADELIAKIIQDIQSQTRPRNISPRQKDYSPEMIKAISYNLAAMLSHFNVSIERGDNREWEVGQKSPYDDIDNPVHTSQCKNVVTIPAHHANSHYYSVENLRGL